MNHALGITNLVRLFDQEMVIIAWASAVLPTAFHGRMPALSAMPELDVSEAVRQHLTRRGVTPPTIVCAQC